MYLIMISNYNVNIVINILKFYRYNDLLRLIDDKLWDREVIIAQKTPIEDNDSNEKKVRLRCNIEDNAIIFFKSKYL